MIGILTLPILTAASYRNIRYTFGTLQTMRITYLLESTTLWGGVKVVFEQAEALCEAGHQVTILSKDRGPDWYPLKLPVRCVDSFTAATIPESDIVVGTYWTTVRAAYVAQRGTVAHLCQGYEGANKELYPMKERIDEVYALDVPKLTVSPHLNQFLRERFGSRTYYVGQMVNQEILFPAYERAHDTVHRRPRVLIVGPFEADVKNIANALLGVRHARDALGLQVALTRVSQFPLTDEERDLLEADEYHCHLPFVQMGDIYRSADALVSVSKEAEGFGLPPLEAMACGLPVILSRIPSYLSFDDTPDYAIFVDGSDPLELADAIKAVVNDQELRERLRRRGLKVATRFTKEAVVRRLTQAFREITGR